MADESMKRLQPLFDAVINGMYDTAFHARTAHPTQASPQPTTCDVCAGLRARENEARTAYQVAITEVYG